MFQQAHAADQRGCPELRRKLPTAAERPAKVVMNSKRNALASAFRYGKSPSCNNWTETGAIWGGRWFHYDTMHFEYRPELIEPEHCVTGGSLP